MRQPPARLAIGALDLGRPHDAAASMPGAAILRRAEGVVWAGSEPPVLMCAEGGLPRNDTPEGIIDAAEGADGRLILLTPAGIKREAADGTFADVFTFGAEDATRRMQVAPLGPNHLVAIVSGEGIGEPSELLVLPETRADGTPAAARSLTATPPPRLFVQASEITGDGGFPGGTFDATYVYACAYQFADGSTGPLSAPSAVYFLPAPAVDGNSYELTFTIDAYDDAPPPDAIALALYLGKPARPGDDIVSTLDAPLGFAGLFSDLSSAADVGSGSEGSITVSMTDAEVLALPEQPRGNLLVHGFRAGAIFTYSGRALLGDLVTDFSAPSALQAFTYASATEDATYTHGVRLEYEVEVEGGRRIRRIGEPAYLSAAEAANPATTGIWFEADPDRANNAIAFADPRVRAVHIYAKRPGDPGYTLYATAARVQRGVASPVTSAYFNEPLDLTAAAGAAMDDPSTLTDTFREPGSIVTTNGLFAREVYATTFLRLSGDEAVLQMGAQTQAVASGQFGDFPVVVACQKSLRALRLGSGQAAFTDAPALSARLGGASRRCLANIDGGLALLSGEGLYLLDPYPRTLLSAPLHRQHATGITSDDGTDASTDDPAPASDLLTWVGADASVGYYTYPDRDRREIWVSLPGAPSGGTVYVYSLAAGRWSELRRHRTGFAGSSGIVASVGSGLLWDDGADDLGAQYVRLEIGPIGMGDPYVRKRLRRMALRMRPAFDRAECVLFETEASAAPGEMPRAQEVARAVLTAAQGRGTLSTPRGHGYAFVLTVEADARPGQSLHSLEIEYEIRRPQRVRR